MFSFAAKVFVLLSLSGSLVFAQSRPVDSAQVKKLYRPWTTFTSLRMVQLFDKGSSLYGEFSYVIPDEYVSLNEYYKSFLWLGYEQAFSEKWYGGISGKANFVEQGGGSFFTRFNLAHRGNIGKLFFYKEVAFEYLSYTRTRGYKRADEGRFSPSMGLGRKFMVAEKPLYVGINYRLFVNFDFKDDNSSIYDKRKIDRTKLRGEVSYGILPHWYLGVYYMRDTEYYYVLGGFDSSMNPIPDYKINRITEGLGITLTYLLFKENGDKYITELPAR